MNQPFGMPPFDPSKMDPKVLMQLSELMRQLPPAQIQKMQTLMHNMMAGFDVKKDMEEFEKSLPPGFRDKMMSLLGGPGAAAAFTPPTPQASNTIEVEPSSTPENSPEMNLRNARMTILQAVADGRMSPDQAEKLLFPE
jgi:hypothetical protein